MPNKGRSVAVRPELYPDLPDDDPGPGEYRCPDCGCRVTVGQSGLQYGHRSFSYGADNGPCPRRPVSMLSEAGRRSRGIGEGDP